MALSDCIRTNLTYLYLLVFTEMKVVLEIWNLYLMLGKEM